MGRPMTLWGATNRPLALFEAYASADGRVVDVYGNLQG